MADEGQRQRDAAFLSLIIFTVRRALSFTLHKFPRFCGRCAAGWPHEDAPSMEKVRAGRSDFTIFTTRWRTATTTLLCMLTRGPESRAECAC